MMNEEEQEARMKELAKAQVRAFIEETRAQFGVDETALKRVVTTTSRNGKVYVTISALLAVVLSISGWLVIDKMSRSDEDRRYLDSRLRVVEDRQQDVRERLRTIERHVYQKDWNTVR
jgi:hypothetical protein